jgi:TolA-binding protein
MLNAKTRAGLNSRKAKSAGKRILCTLVLCLMPWAASFAQTPGATTNSAENAAYLAAARAFQLGIFENAEKGLDSFLQSYPESSRLSEAILLDARAKINRAKLAAAIDLLATNLPKAGLLSDQYRFWLGESYMQSSNYTSAAEMFSSLIRNHPESVRVLEASYDEALARFRLKEWSKVVELLQAPDGVFQTAARQRANDELVARGALLAAEALYSKGDYEAAEKGLQELAGKDLFPEAKWWRNYHLCRVQMARHHLADALGNSTNLLSSAAAAGKRKFQTESVFLQGEILELMDQPEEAAKVYALNEAENLPAEDRRQALVKIIELSLSEQKTVEAAQKIERFLKQYPEDKASDAVLLCLGELHLRQHFSGSDTNGTNAVAVTTNALQQAQGEFDFLLKNFPQSALAGLAQLNRGWCFWIQEKVPESIAAFKAATEKLSFPEDLAEARFKLGDGLFRQGDLTNALATYSQIVSNYSDVARVKNVFLDQVLYQMLRVSLELNDVKSAAAALKSLLAAYPNSPLNDRSMLLVGQKLARVGRASEGRNVLLDFISKFPGDSLVPQVELAVARTYFQENNWLAAAAKYDEWIERHTNSALLPEAESDRAWCNFRAGNETNALMLYTNFLAQFPNHQLAPLAKNWVADYYFRQGDYRTAEKNYQALFQSTNWPTSSLTYQGRMMAGRCAFARQVYKDADTYFTELINVLPNDSSELIAEAWLRLGDTIAEGSQLDPAKPYDSRFGSALVAFGRITQQYPSNHWATLAWGRIGDCNFQLAAQDPERYASATNAYLKVIESPLADVSARNQAEFGIGMVLERQAQAKGKEEGLPLQKLALEHYYKILFSENPDPYWLKEAGFAAARLAEDQKEWETAINIYNRIGSLLPPLKAAMERKMDKAREQMHVEKG